MKKIAGFTLIELMLTVVVLSIVLGIGVPAFRNFILNNRLTTQANDFMAAVQMARSEAVRWSGGVVRITATNPTTDNEWGGGWIIWADADGDGIQDAGEVLHKVDSLSGGNMLNSTTDISQFICNGDGSITPDALQLTDGRTSSPDCSAGLRPARTITVRGNGQTSIGAGRCL